MKNVWVNRKLGDLAKMNYGYSKAASFEPIGPKFLRITDIHNNHVNWDTVPYCPIPTSDIPKYQLKEGDIVFARTGATTGKSYLITEPPNSVFASYLIRVQLNSNEIVPSFLLLFFQTSSYWKSIKLGLSGSAQGGFNATKLKDLVITYPKLLSEQKYIVDTLGEAFEGIAIAKSNAKKNLKNARNLFESHRNAIETCHLESIYQKKLDALEELKKSLLNQAFTGNLLDTKSA